MSGQRKYPAAADDNILDPLKIELILARVFSFLKPEDLKNCRLVGKLWKNVATDELGSQTYFAIQKLQFRIHPMILHPRLLQRIKIQLERGPEAESVSYLIPFLTYHRGQVEWIRIQGPNYFLPPLKTILEAVEFPNLTKISLEEEYFNPNPAQCLNPTLGVTLNNVKILEILVSQNGSGGTNAVNFPAFQLLINQCPNLEGLKIIWHFYPDLSSCTKLKSLNWVGPVAEKRDYRTGGYYLTFETWALFIPKLFKVLEPIRDTLEDLTLGPILEQECAHRGFQDGYKVYLWTIPPQLVYLYPCMPKLTKLSVSDVMMFCIHPDSFIQSRLPALKFLTLRSTQVMEFPIKRLLLKWKQEESKVNAETLSLNQYPVGEVEMIYDIAKIFPNLKKLTLGITDVEKSEDDPDEELSTAVGSTPPPLHNAQLFKNTLNAISHVLPSLTELTIYIKFVCTLEELMDRLCAEGFNGKDLKLKVVIPKNDGFMNIEDSGCENFAQAFTLYPKGLRLEGFELKGATRKKMRDFILEKKSSGCFELNLIT